MKQQRKTKLVFGKFLTILGVIVGYTLIFSWGIDFILCDLLHLNERVDGIVISFLVYAAMSTLLIFVLEKIGKMHILKFEKERFFRGLLMGLPMILLGIFLFYRNFSGAINEGLEILPVFEIVLFSAVILLGVGFTEEVLYRGIVENLLFDIFGRKTKKAVYLSVLISGFLFGVWHLGNIFADGANWGYVVAQSIVVIGIGMVFGAIYARSRSIFATIFLHGFWDLCQTVRTGWFLTDEALLPFELVEGVPVVFMVLVAILPLSIGVAYTIFLMRDKTKAEYLD